MTYFLKTSNTHKRYILRESFINYSHAKQEELAPSMDALGRASCFFSFLYFEKFLLLHLLHRKATSILICRKIQIQLFKRRTFSWKKKVVEILCLVCDISVLNLLKIKDTLITTGCKICFRII